MAGAGGEGSGRPGSQAATHSGSGNAPDDPGSCEDPKTLTGMSYADVSKVFHKLSVYELVLCHDSKNY